MSAEGSRRGLRRLRWTAAVNKVAWKSGRCVLAKESQPRRGEVEVKASSRWESHGPKRVISFLMISVYIPEYQ